MQEENQLANEQQLDDLEWILEDELSHSPNGPVTPGRILQGQHGLHNEISPRMQTFNLMQQLNDEQQLEDFSMNSENIEDGLGSSASILTPGVILQGQHPSSVSKAHKQRLNELIQNDDQIEEFEISLNESFLDSPFNEFSRDLLQGQHQLSPKTPVRESLKLPRRQLEKMFHQIADESHFGDLDNTEIDFANSPDISSQHYSAERGNLGQLIIELGQDGADEVLMDVVMDLVQSPPKSPVEPATIFGEIQNAMQEIKRKAGTLSSQNISDVNSQQLLLTLAAQLKGIMEQIR